jgi:2-haloacid dehalogenase
LAYDDSKPTIKAIAFDAFTTFDPRPIVALAEQLFPTQGAALGNAWRTRQFEYTWLRSVGHHYVDFWTSRPMQTSDRPWSRCSEQVSDWRCYPT